MFNPFAIHTAAYACFVLGALAGTAPGQGLIPDNDTVPRLIIDNALQEKTFQVISMSATSIIARDPAGRKVTIPRASVLAIIPLNTGDSVSARKTRERTWLESDHASSRRTSLVILTDGQTLPGSVGTEPAPDHLTWQSRLWGPVSIPLDAVSWIKVRPFENTSRAVKPPSLLPSAAAAPATATPPTEDSTLLINGDRVQGLVASIAASLKPRSAETPEPAPRGRENAIARLLAPNANVPQGTLTLDKDGTSATLPLERVDSITFANPTKPPVGTVVWLQDGTITGASSLLLNPDAPFGIIPPAILAPAGTVIASRPATTPTPEAREAKVPGSDIRAILFDGARLRTLASLPLRVSGDGAHATAADIDSAPLGASDIHIEGPASVEWDLPPAATRLACTLELPLSARIWGDCTATLTHIANGTTTQLLKERFRGEAPSKAVNVALAPVPKGRGSVLRLTLEAGPLGPIQNRIVLRRPLVLLGSP